VEPGHCLAHENRRRGNQQGLPYVYGAENGFHISKIDYEIEGGPGPPPEYPIRPHANSIVPSPG
jgi:hypothetical protein